MKRQPLNPLELIVPLKPSERAILAGQLPHTLRVEREGFFHAIFSNPSLLRLAQVLISRYRFPTSSFYHEGKFYPDPWAPDEAFDIEAGQALYRNGERAWEVKPKKSSDSTHTFLWTPVTTDELAQLHGLVPFTVHPSGELHHLVCANEHDLHVVLLKLTAWRNPSMFRRTVNA